MQAVCDGYMQVIHWVGLDWVDSVEYMMTCPRHTGYSMGKMPLDLLDV